ncbi:HpcH/HpaI aldolase/citrate lyase family protein [Planococcus halotolerans]|uniref:Citrate lyase beta chain n=1 Tax=Planococcus halotolerans TaxID=2233542 RepID=A0A365L6D2_9BACL|nr:HpcH/HpaI aldolase/citrate lyase family protein [Planococcus halotolerans]QHJ70327.1 HpcH/HpaI aldolase/citrate lyase family protein [Planococcus halotolerans]RAZ80943.1 citrate lyase beta chain [Planococcus halotolerans]
MRHFNALDDSELQTFFKYPPAEFNRDTDREKLGLALGAALYTPGSRPDFAAKIIAGSYRRDTFSGLATLMICLEDAVADTELESAEANVVSQLKVLEQASQSHITESPLLFLRIRNSDQLDKLTKLAGSSLSMLTGIVLPKVQADDLEPFFLALDRASESAGRKLYALPLLETEEVLFAETREQALMEIYSKLRQEKDRILTIRVGATDFSSLYGLRRPVERTIYDVHLIRDCLISILNKFTKAGDGFIVSGPVYEYFTAETDAWLSSKPEKTLWEEVQLDVLNGFKGKTCIHPSQIAIVNAGHIITHETYEDAMLILAKSDTFNGILQSPQRNKMNEVKPHLSWAKKIAAQAEIYGVLNEYYKPIDVLNHIRAKQLANQV